MCGAEPFKQNPPFRYGFRNFGNSLRVVGGTIGALNTSACCTKTISDEEALAPTTVPGMRAYYSPRRGIAAPAMFRTYVPASVAGGGSKADYMALISGVGEWLSSLR